MTTSPQPSGAEPLSADELSEYSKMVKMDLPPGQDQAFYRWGNEAVDRLLATIAQRDQKIEALEENYKDMNDQRLKLLTGEFEKESRIEHWRMVKELRDRIAALEAAGDAMDRALAYYAGPYAGAKETLEAWRKLREGR